MMDWLGKMLDLPPEFLASSGGKGGGVIQVTHFTHSISLGRFNTLEINCQGTASEATLVALLSAKSRTLSKLKRDNPDADVSSFAGRLVAYTSGNLCNPGRIETRITALML